MAVDPKKIARLEDALKRYAMSAGAPTRFAADVLAESAAEVVPSLISEAESLRALLREVEWAKDYALAADSADNDLLIAIDDDPSTKRIRYCPVCREDEDEGHAPDCRLASALREET